MKLIWVSDIHLNFLEKFKREQFYKTLKGGDAIIASGDIAESHNVVPILTEMQQYISKPVYFVLGNHDFYGSDVASVKRSVKPLGYLGSKQFVALTPSTALVGVDGWGDCRYGDFENSHIVMNDWWYIDDLRRAYNMADQDMLKEALQLLADKDARSLKRKVNAALKQGFTKIIITTHVPPFEDACLYAGRKSTPGGLPFFASKILGEMLLPTVIKNPDVDFLWLSGHTHSRVTYHPCANMEVKVAKAEYYCPQVEDVIEIEGDF